jgi:hypothetical protein
MVAKLLMPIWEDIADLMNSLSPAARRKRAVNKTLQRYPAFSTLGPIELTEGNGPYQSETYLPNDPDNPDPGKLDIQLRSAESKDPGKYEDEVASEALHGVEATDPVYRALTQQFVKSMTPDELAESKQVFKQQGGGESFKDWLPRVQAQEYIRGALFPKLDDPTGEWRSQLTPGQVKLMRLIQAYLSRGPQTISADRRK